MGYTDHNVIQHDFGFPRVVHSADAELEALESMKAGRFGTTEQRGCRGEGWRFTGELRWR